MGLTDQYSKGHFSWNLVSAKNNKIKDEKCWSCESVAGAWRIIGGIVLQDEVWKANKGPDPTESHWLLKSNLDVKCEGKQLRRCKQMIGATQG